MLQIAEEHVESNSRTGMPQVWITIDSRAADIHTHVGSVQRLEELLAAGERIINQ